MSLSVEKLMAPGTATGPAHCYHCGLPCDTGLISFDQKSFCCQGCRMVYEILAENDLCRYYDLNAAPGASPKKAELPERFAYLDDALVLEKLIDFQNDTIAKVTFYIPNIRCSSCIWLLEKLHRLNPAIPEARVNFLRRELALTFRHREVSLRQVVELLAAIGYEPHISLDKTDPASQQTNRRLYKQIGVAGFCFGNIMLLSFPEYLAVGGTLSPAFRQFFGILNVLLALPVLLYSGRDYLASALQALRHHSVNIDVPLSLGIVTMFTRSVYEIWGQHGAGYMDSFAGLVFLLLLGKLFQQKSYDHLSFERDYKSFFPISITRREGAEEKSIPLSRLQVGDRILVRHQELIPADAVLIDGAGWIDYSFVTGESDPVRKSPGDLVYAGGRQMGSTIELEVIKAVSQSYLTQLWNNDAFKHSGGSQLSGFADAISKYFTLAILVIAGAAGLYWLPLSTAVALNAFTAVLIIACPCALALSTPFTLGNVLRILGRQQFYLKNTAVVEVLAGISTVVFDKTGTLTQSRQRDITFVSLNGCATLSGRHCRLVKSLVRHSRHPLSAAIFQALPGPADAPVDQYAEIPGQGISAMVEGQTVRIGSAQFAGNGVLKAVPAAGVFLRIDGQVKGYFSIAHHYRPGLAGLIRRLHGRYRLALLSGDNDRERSALTRYLGEDTPLLFNQSPQQKLDFIRDLQSRNERVLMIGDGLNDAGALKQSDVGISITEDVNNFSPACDGILHAGQFSRLDAFLKFSKTARHIIRVNLGLSLVYNVAGLSFAVTGTLSPLICAVLMPLSSVSVIFVAMIATNFLAKRSGFHYQSGSREKSGIAPAM